ncbi:uncharacterized protein LOC134745562 [Cydia strobilella]|uniref:uncharacterized protein LOC134745562 n=1 Tax=Cydia strobilella TaxID=1100964 RepID=UPI0030058D50
MASNKVLCIVFILALVGEIRANVDSDVATAPKQLQTHQILPPSLLYLLHEPIRHPRLLTPPVAPSLPVPPTPPVAPSLPVPPKPPVAPSLPVPPTPPVAPSLPVPPALPTAPNTANPLLTSILFLLNRPIRHQNSQPANPGNQANSPQHRNLQKLPYSDLYPSSASAPITPPVSAAEKPSNPQYTGQLSYDPSSGNRKILNVVHIPVRPVAPNKHQKTSTSENKAENTPVGPAPFSPKVSTNSQPEDLSPIPNNPIGASPIPAKPDSAENDNTITIRPKDLPNEPVDNIEALPIPVRPNDKTTEDTKNIDKSKDSTNLEELSLIPSQTKEESQIPSKPNEAKYATTENTSVDELNSSDSQDANSASPINAKQEENNPEGSNTEPGQEETNPGVLGENTSQNANADNTAMEKRQDKTAEDSRETSEEPQNPFADLILNGSSSEPNSMDKKDVKQTGTSSNDKDNEQPEEVKENPMKDVILNGTPSEPNSTEEKDGQTGNLMANAILNGTSPNDSDHKKPEEVKENPMKDVILNGTPSEPNSTEEKEGQTGNLMAN